MTLAQPINAARSPLPRRNLPDPRIGYAEINNKAWSAPRKLIQMPFTLIIEETSSRFLRPERKPLRIDRLRWLTRDSKVTNLSVLRGSVVNSNFKVIS